MRIETQKKWRTLIKQHADSDLSIGQFCKDKRISQACFFNYLMHLLEELPKEPDDLEPLLPWNVELEQKI